MIYSTKEKLGKTESNMGSVPISPSITDATSKKKMFSRKPAYGVGNLVPEKKKPTLEESINALTHIRPSADSFRSSHKLSEAAEWKLRDKASEMGRSTGIKTDGSIQNCRQIFYSPKSDKNLLAGVSRVLQRKPSKNSTDFKPNNSQDPFSRSTVGYAREMSEMIDVSMESENFRRNWKCKTSSVQSFNTPAKPTTEARISSEKSLKEESLVVECIYCLTHKKKADLLAEKCGKLEEQLSGKTQAFKELSKKYETLLKDKGDLCQKLESAIEKLQTKEEEFFRAREEMTHRIDAFKKDVIRLTENIKYNEIEKSMLLRFKNDYYQLASQHEQLKAESERLRYQAEQYKKQLIAEMNKKHGYSFAKRSPATTEAPNAHFSKKPSQNSPVQTNIYYDCEDDALSLNFSEQSYDYL